jgi:hypothetical protein
MKKPLVVAGALAATLSVLTAARATAQTLWTDDPVPSWAQDLPGCRGAAVAHQDGEILSPQPTDGPAACGMTTGVPAVENRIEVTDDGVLIYNPALLDGGPYAGTSGHVYGPSRPNGLARSRDEGATWDTTNFQVFPDNGTIAAGAVDQNLYVDHGTNRLFFYVMQGGPGVGHIPYACGGGGGALVAFTSDNGNRWDWGFDGSHSCAENPTILSGKRTISQGSTVPYPNVVYLCGDNTSTGVGGVGTPGNSCSKSLDGGQTWLGTSLYGLGPTKTAGGTSWPLGGPQAIYSGSSGSVAGCASPSAGFGVQPLSNDHPGEGLPAGTLLVVMSCAAGSVDGAGSYLARSTDEGGSWSVVAPKLPHGGSLRVDSADNLYLLSGPLLDHSTDLGLTWSTPRDTTLPGVNRGSPSFFIQGTHAPGMIGHIGIAYYGSGPGSTGLAGRADGFITATQDALVDDPIFWTGRASDPAKPLLAGANIGITVTDFNGGAWSPDGRSAWGSWVQDCGTNAVTDPNCQSRIPTTNPANPSDGFAGRLVWPPQ